MEYDSELGKLQCRSCQFEQAVEDAPEIEEELDPLDEVKQLIASGTDKKTALAQVAKKRRIPKRELYNQLISEGEGISE